MGPPWVNQNLISKALVELPNSVNMLKRQLSAGAERIMKIEKPPSQLPGIRVVFLYSSLTSTITDFSLCFHPPQLCHHLFSGTDLVTITSVSYPHETRYDNSSRFHRGGQGILFISLTASKSGPGYGVCQPHAGQGKYAALYQYRCGNIPLGIRQFLLHIRLPFGQAAPSQNKLSFPSSSSICALISHRWDR